jgi:hypothetical protein
VTTCAQPGCGGTIQDGYCDTRGLAATAPSAPSGPSAWSGSGQSSRSRSRGRGSSRSARGRLGAGLVEIPPVPYRDPASAILADPQVPENKRYCSGCDQPVGRDWDGRPGLTKGFCRSLALADDARGAFSAVFDELPGEIAPKLALAFAAEAAGDVAAAGHYFRLVWTVDTSCTSAAFGGVQLTVEILRAALDWCTTGQLAGHGPILGCEPNARALRFGLERSYRALARLTPDEDRRIELVDMANAIRPRTLT